MSKRAKKISSTSKQPQKKARKSKSVSESKSSKTSETNPQKPLTIYNLPCELLPLIFNHLETYEQFKIRRVCHFWKNSIEKMFQLKRCLKLNLIWTGTKHEHNWAPATSMQSLQFDSNWSEPALELYKKAHIIVQKPDFKADCVNAIGRLFSQVNYLVIYLNFNNCEERQVFKNFISMVGHFKVLESFSLIKSKILKNEFFIPNLCDTLEELYSLRRLELYVEHEESNRRNDDADVTKWKKSMIRSLGSLKHFALSCWPIAITPDDQQEILKNVGVFHKNVPGGTNKPLELTTLCIPMKALYLSESHLDMTHVFGSNPQLQNVKRLQLTNVNKEYDSVRQALELCPKLQSLELFNCDSGMEINTNSIIEMINKCKHLTELKILDSHLSPFEAGPNAPQIRKLTIGAKYWFEFFKYFLRDRDGDEDVYDGEFWQIDQIRATWQVKIADEFVKLISLKFPALDELTVLTDADDDDIGLYELKSMIINKLRATSEKLKVNIELEHAVYYVELYLD